jgi:photosynthetic reaction center H subunit
MQQGAITGYFDVAQITLYAFWIFFAGLILYLRREDKREGYPLESDRSANVRVRGYPDIPAPKTYLLPHGGSMQLPSPVVEGPALMARAFSSAPGSPIIPEGNPMLSGLGPGAYVERTDEPDLTADGKVRIVPLRVATDHWIAKEDRDPRGFKVVGADRVVAGTLHDVWVDIGEAIVRYYEVAIDTAGGVRHVLLPSTMADVKRKRGVVEVTSIMGAQFADVPGLQNPDQVTLREEDRICAYYGGGTLYAHPKRLEPLV